MFLFFVLLVCSTSAYAMDNDTDEIIEGILIVEGAQIDGWSNVATDSLSPDKIGIHTPIYGQVWLTFTPLSKQHPSHKFELSFEQVRGLRKGKKWQHRHRKNILLQAIISEKLVEDIQRIQS